MTNTEKAVWAAWNALPDDCPAPVKTIARDLDMTPADVAFIVYPADKFGRWEDDQEPDLDRGTTWVVGTLHGTPTSIFEFDTMANAVEWTNLCNSDPENLKEGVVAHIVLNRFHVSRD